MQKAFETHPLVFVQGQRKFLPPAQKRALQIMQMQQKISAHLSILLFLQVSTQKTA
ncbi:MAG: hypothetical protein IJW40_08810 [Clostridia bacterium]|nr:hypothetical protein [Clostridia bacterium]